MDLKPGLPLSIYEIYMGQARNRRPEREAEIARVMADPVESQRVYRLRRLLLILARLGVLASARRFNAGKETG